MVDVLFFYLIEQPNLQTHCLKNAIKNIFGQFNYKLVLYHNHMKTWKKFQKDIPSGLGANSYFRKKTIYSHLSHSLAYTLFFNLSPKLFYETTESTETTYVFIGHVHFFQPKPKIVLRDHRVHRDHLCFIGHIHFIQHEPKIGL